MTHFQIQPMHADLAARLGKHGFTQKNHCYKNCCGVVLQLGVGDYVLCTITEQDGTKHGHAVVGFKGKYFDPTIDIARSQTLVYEAVRTFSRGDLEAFMLANGAIKDPDGSISGFPPKLLPNGDIVCTA
ncbi:hypothetical protein [Burkholderia territorii]|uniref:hypothetical protein n=1 Tax=Burkholderia territorii TaxID=1503055 RepID=UPI0012D87279|nr:hypothetical protein [Burkholderia territorii]